MPVPVEIDVARGPDELSLIAVRHASGALTFHAPALRIEAPGGGRRGAAGRRARAVTDRYSIDVPSNGTPARRGIVLKLLKMAVLKVLRPAIDAARDTAVGLAASGGERALWRARGLERGWRRVRVGGSGLVLTGASPADFGRSERALLLLHGTFSHAAGAFAGLSGDFLTRAREIYGDRIFAFNHFTVSDTPEDNVRALLDGIPGEGRRFDVITHSRGGLVLRHAVERPDLFGSRAGRFGLGHAVLVASPNAGTPLATPDRYRETFGLFANLLELLPDNPWTTLPELVATGIVWLASNAVPSLKGLASMDEHGPIISALQEAPAAPLGAYSALCANYEPDGAVLARLVDAGIDRFFASANDLVVPTEGGWRVDDDARNVQAERVGCFGPGGNLSAANGTAVTHVNFFGLPETTEFLLRALRGQAQGLHALDLGAALPARRGRRGAIPPATPTALTPPRRRGRETVPEAPLAVDDTRRLAVARGLRYFGHDVLQLMILGRAGEEAAPDPGDIQILAMYGSARAVERFPTRNETPGAIGPRRRTRAAGRATGAADSGGDGEAGSRFSQIIASHRRIRSVLSGDVAEAGGRTPTLPDEAGLREFGEALFRNLFVGRVQRLYDVARSEQRDRPLNVIFTCSVPWLAALPWEFAFDPIRRKFLVTEELHFVRNVLTTVPAQDLESTTEALRILVVAAEPVGTQPLAVEEEEARIREGFRRLTDAGLVDIHVLTDVTPDRFHRAVEAATRQAQPFDVVHFSGHGEFDRRANAGILVFTDATGRPHDVSIRTLREILSNRGIRLVFLNACDTARDDAWTLNRGVAQALVEAGLPAVVANQYPVLDASAVGFAEHFYWSLGTGGTLGEAAREARIALNYSIEGEVIDWAVPVLYARDPNYQLCHPRPVRQEPPRPRAIATAETAAPTVSPRRKAAKARKQEAAPRILRVGVADFTRFFSGLDALLVRLNQVQSRVDFKSVDLTVPLGVWRQSKQTPLDDEGRKNSYLDADAFGERLKAKPSEIKVDLLIGATDQWMMCVERGQPLYRIFWWWRADPGIQLGLFSTAGFPVRRKGPATDRLLTNALVSIIAGKLLEEATGKDSMHERGPRTCPFFFNPERNFELLAERRTFDTRCRKRLEKRLPVELIRAFEVLLALDHQT